MDSVATLMARSMIYLKMVRSFSVLPNFITALLPYSGLTLLVGVTLKRKQVGLFVQP